MSYTNNSNSKNDDDEPRLGLGYSNNNSNNSNNGAQSNVDALMKQYLQQCLEYHNEQLQQKQQQQQQDSPEFLPASNNETEPIIEEHSSTTNDSSNKPEMLVIVPKDSLAKARAVAQSFYSYATVPQEPLAAPILPVSDYKQQRIQHFEQEQVKFQQAWIKNLNYITKRQEQRIKHQQEQIEHVKRQEQRLDQQHREHYNNRTSSFTSTMPKQTMVQRNFSIAPFNKHYRNNDTASAAALYISGLPPATISESLIRELFESYGSIQKVHLYRHKSTGTFKGDGLLVFRVLESTTKEELVHLVCSQVSTHATWSVNVLSYCE